MSHTNNHGQFTVSPLLLTEVSECEDCGASLNDQTAHYLEPNGDGPLCFACYEKYPTEEQVAEAERVVEAVIQTALHDHAAAGISVPVARFVRERLNAAGALR